LPLSSPPLPVYIGFVRLGQLHPKSLIIPYGGFLGKLDGDSMGAFRDEIRRLFANRIIDMVHASFVERSGIVDTELRDTYPRLFRGYQPDIMHRFIQLADSVEAMYLQIQAKKRKWLYQMRALQRDFNDEVKLEVFTRENEIDRLLELAGEVSSKTWKRGLGVDIIKSRHRNQYLLWAAETGRMRGYVLTIKDRPASFWIGSQFDQTFYLDYCDFDPAFRKYSLGHLTLIRLYEDLIRNTTLRTVDFQADNIAYKKRYGNVTIPERNIRLFSPNLRGAFLNMVDSSTALTTDWGAKFLEKVNFRATMKRWRKERQENRARKKTTKKLGFQLSPTGGSLAMAS
jgi:hypothetical protein